MKKVCSNYVGLACVDGSCPKALRDEYLECCMDAISDCSDCPYVAGCDDCINSGTCGLSFPD